MTADVTMADAMTRGATTRPVGSQTDRKGAIQRDALRSGVIPRAAMRPAVIWPVVPAAAGPPRRHARPHVRAIPACAACAHVARAVPSDPARAIAPRPA